MGLRNHQNDKEEAFVTVSYSSTRGKNGPEKGRVEWSVPARGYGSFFVKREHAADKLFKVFGLISELQLTQQSEHNQHYFFSTPHPTETRRFFENPEVMRVVTAIFAQSIDRLEYKGDRFVAVQDTFRGSQEMAEADARRKSLAQDLDKLARCAHTLFGPHLKNSSRSFNNLRRLATYGTWAAVFIAIMLTVLVPLFGRPIEFFEIFTTGLQLRVGLTIVAGLYFLLKARSVALEAKKILSGLIGVGIFCMVIVADLGHIANVHFDTTLGEQRMSVVTSRWTSRSKNKTNYNLGLQSMSGARVPSSIGVSASRYGNTQEGYVVTFKVHPGYFGIEWYESGFSIAPKAQ
jgi:hypothetical protein